RFVEHAGVEIGISIFFRQREQGYLVIGWLHARDRILPALGDPGRSVWADGDAMRRGTFSKTDRLVRAVTRGQSAQHTAALAGEPDRAVGRGRRVVQAGARSNRKIFCAEWTVL